MKEEASRSDVQLEVAVIKIKELEAAMSNSEAEKVAALQYSQKLT